MVIWECLEELYGFEIVVTPSSSWIRLSGPVDGDILCVALLELLL